MDKIEEIAKAVKIKEGFFEPGSEKYPDGSLSFRNNNPGNILAGALAKELGATGEYKSPNGLTYAVWPTYEDGFYALKKFLMLGFRGDLRSYNIEMNLKEFFKVYSGGGETYGQFVADKTGIDINTKIRHIYDLFWDQANKEAIEKGDVKEIAEEAELQVKNQDQAKYEKMFLGKSKSSFRLYGCKLFSLTTLYNYYHNKSVDVTTVNDMLYQGGAYFGKSGDMLDDVTAANILGLNFLGREYDIEKDPEWSPTIKEVDFSPTAGKQQHFVVRIIKEDGTLAILDPWGGVQRKVNYYEALTGNADWSKGGFSYRKFNKK